MAPSHVCAAFNSTSVVLKLGKRTYNGAAAITFNSTSVVLKPDTMIEVCAKDEPFNSTSVVLKQSVTSRSRAAQSNLQ